MKNKKGFKNEYINDDDLIRYMNLPAEKKLEYIEEMRKFLQEAMSPESKEIAKKLREEGF